MKLGELILYVYDMPKMVSFYRDQLRLSVRLPTEGGTDFSTVDWVEFETGECSLALHSDRAVDSTPGVVEVVFFVENFDERRQELIDAGIKMKEPWSPAPGVRVSNGIDPEGNPFAIEERD